MNELQACGCTVTADIEAAELFDPYELYITNQSMKKKLRNKTNNVLYPMHSMEDLLEISETMTVIDLADGGTFIADSDNISDEHLPLVISFFSTLAMFSKQVKGDKAVDKDFNRGIGRIQKKHSPRESHQI